MLQLRVQQMLLMVCLKTPITVREKTESRFAIPGPGLKNELIALCTRASAHLLKIVCGCSVIPVKTGIQGEAKSLDFCFRKNDKPDKVSR